MISKAKQYRSIRCKEKKHRKLKKSCRIFLFSMVVTVSTLGGFELYNRTYTPSIQGKWISQETGQLVEFTKKGQVKVDKQVIGKYDIKDSGMMVYHIEDQEFNMIYELEEENLKWGIIGDDYEVFERKSQLMDLKLDIFS